MGKLIGRNRFMILSLSVFITMFGFSAFAKTSPELIKQEEGYYYGYGKGETADDAALEAKHDLVSYALTETLRGTNANAATVEPSDKSVNARLAGIKPYAESKSGSAPSVTYRMKIADWDKKEKAYADTLRAELVPVYESIASKKQKSDKINLALSILARLEEEGETNLLTIQQAGTELLSKKAEAALAETGKSLVFTVSVKDGFINPSTQFSAKVSDSSGNAAANIQIAVTWETPMLPTDNAVESPAEVRSFVKSDSLGNAVIEYPASEEYHNRPVTLTVSTAFAESVPSSSSLKKMDAENSVDACYVYFDDIEKSFPCAAVQAGEFDAGAVPQDNRASKKEVSRKANTGAYSIDMFLVTNAKYAEFLHATRSADYPEFFDNTDYNQGNQPVVGVTLENAEAYAAWLSDQTGFKYRLPTEEEWEKAARAGKDVIYPWGDDSPSKAKNANYKGNGRYSAPSPVGSFENGKNELGLADMAGNVWEWTSSVSGSDTESSLKIVKGGSWMDGPNDLRISNFRTIDSLKGYADVGFRLIRENNNQEVSE